VTRAHFLGETFYGVDAADALAAAREFAADVGPDALEMFDDGNVKLEQWEASE
jgi:hypothetical protein